MTTAEWIRKSIKGDECEACGNRWIDVPDTALISHWLGNCKENTDKDYVRNPTDNKRIQL